MATWQGYLGECRKFREVAQRLDAGACPRQLVNNVVLAAVAANDALGVWRTGQAAGAHSDADILSLLSRACSGTPMESALPQRTGQLRSLLTHEWSASRGGPVLEAAAREVMTEAADFIDWVEDILAAERPKG